MKIWLLIILLLIILPGMYALEECKGTITPEESPCILILPYFGTCSDLGVDIYFNASTFLYHSTMGVYAPFSCNASFNQTVLGTYVFNYTTGDSGSIIIEAGNMNFFNLSIYMFFTGVIITFIVLMHKYKEDSGSSVVYGVFASTIGIILGALILSPAYDVIHGITFIIDVNYYLSAVSFGLALYTALVSVSLYRQAHPKAEDWY